MEPMAWDFVMHFARDNELFVVDDPSPAETHRDHDATECRSGPPASPSS